LYTPPKHTISEPNKRERRGLRLLIGLGVLSIAAFAIWYANEVVIGNYFMYVCLTTTFIYYALKYLHEWIHYSAIEVPERPVLQHNFSVDVLTTYVPGEPFEMLEKTLRAMVAMSYPHTNWCCVEKGGDPKVEQLCADLGVRYISRVENTNAKAGNINHALQFATGEIVVVLDPDHIPAPHFLDEVLPFFTDPKVGFVQVVQAYHNIGNSRIAKGAAQQTFQFYGPMMMSMQRFGTVQAIGANCSFRREALDDIGGHAPGLAEDMHTAMLLHARGWLSIYHPVVIARGMVPETLSAYYKQQLKWARGTWELLLTVYPKVFFRLTWRQKLHYLFIPFHYFSGFIVLINLIIPIFCLLTDQFPIETPLLQFLLAAMPITFLALLIRHLVQKWMVEEEERGFHLLGGLLTIGTWWINIAGILFTFFRKKVPYIPTPKAQERKDAIWIYFPNLLIVLVNVAAIVYASLTMPSIYQYYMMGLSLVNILVLSFVGYVGLTDLQRKSSKQYLQQAKISFWKWRHRWYRLARQNAFLLLFLFLSCWLFFLLRNPFAAEEKNLAKLDQDHPIVVDSALVALPWGTPISIPYHPTNKKGDSQEVHQRNEDEESFGGVLNWSPFPINAPLSELITRCKEITNGAWDNYLLKQWAYLQATEKHFLICFAPIPLSLEDPFLAAQGFEWKDRQNKNFVGLYADSSSADQSTDAVYAPNLFRQFQKEYVKMWDHFIRLHQTLRSRHSAPSVVWGYDGGAPATYSTFFPHPHVRWLQISLPSVDSSIVSGFENQWPFLLKWPLFINVSLPNGAQESSVLKSINGLANKYKTVFNGQSRAPLIQIGIQKTNKSETLLSPISPPKNQVFTEKAIEQNVGMQTYSSSQLDTLWGLFYAPDASVGTSFNREKLYERDFKDIQEVGFNTVVLEAMAKETLDICRFLSAQKSPLKLLISLRISSCWNGKKWDDALLRKRIEQLLKVYPDIQFFIADDILLHHQQFYLHPKNWKATIPLEKGFEALLTFLKTSSDSISSNSSSSSLWVACALGAGDLDRYQWYLKKLTARDRVLPVAEEEYDRIRTSMIPLMGPQKEMGVSLEMQQTLTPLRLLSAMPQSIDALPFYGYISRSYWQILMGQQKRQPLQIFGFTGQNEKKDLSLEEFVSLRSAFEQNKLLGSVDSIQQKTNRYKILKPAKVLEVGEKEWFHLLKSTKGSSSYFIPKVHQLTAPSLVQIQWYLVHFNKEKEADQIKKIGEGYSCSITIPENMEQYRIVLKIEDNQQVQTLVEPLNWPIWQPLSF